MCLWPQYAHNVSAATPSAVCACWLCTSACRTACLITSSAAARSCLARFLRSRFACIINKSTSSRRLAVGIAVYGCTRVPQHCNPRWAAAGRCGSPHQSYQCILCPSIQGHCAPVGSIGSLGPSGCVTSIVFGQLSALRLLCSWSCSNRAPFLVMLGTATCTCGRVASVARYLAGAMAGWTRCSRLRSDRLRTRSRMLSSCKAVTTFTEAITRLVHCNVKCGTCYIRVERDQQLCPSIQSATHRSVQLDPSVNQHAIERKQANVPVASVVRMS
jgi:hypothetical protein